MGALSGAAMLVGEDGLGGAALLVGGRGGVKGVMGTTLRQRLGGLFGELHRVGLPVEWGRGLVGALLGPDTQPEWWGGGGWARLGAALSGAALFPMGSELGHSLFRVAAPSVGGGLGAIWGHHCLWWGSAWGRYLWLHCPPQGDCWGAIPGCAAHGRGVVCGCHRVLQCLRQGQVRMVCWHCPGPTVLVAEG